MPGGSRYLIVHLAVAVVALAVVVGLASCLETGAACGDGHCPDGTVCDRIHERCILPAQLESCQHLDHGTACDVPGGRRGSCHDGVCLPIVCGDGVAEGREECDGVDTRAVNDCVALDPRFHEARPLQCRDDCTFDRAACGAVCGDGVVQPDHEACDGAPTGTSCAAEGFHGGELACDASCRLDVTACLGRCGDGIRTAGELCDATDFGVRSCTSEGFHGGTLGCNAACDAIDTSRCLGRCGDGVKNGDEICDGDDLGALSCTAYGWHTGALTCGQDCRSIDQSACAGHCGDGVKNGDELCDGADTGADSCVTRGAQAGALVCSSMCRPLTDQCFWGTLRGVETGLAGAPIAGWARSPHEVWVADDRGGLVHFDGSRWRPSGAGFDGIVSQLWGSGADEVWAYTRDGGLHHLGDGRWSLVHQLRPGARVWASSLANIWSTETEGAETVLRGFDGNEWSLRRLPFEARDVWTSGSNDVWIAGTSALHHFDGTEWTVHAPRSRGREYHNIWGTGPADVWVASASSVHHYDGSWTTWEFSNALVPTLQAWSVGPEAFVAITRSEVYSDMFFGRGSRVRYLTDVPAATGAGWGAPSGDLWLVQAGRLFHLDRLPWFAFTFYGISRGIHLDGDSAWLAGSRGTDRLVTTSTAFENRWEQLTNRASTSVVSANGDLWTAEPPDVWRLHDGVWTRFELGAGVADGRLWGTASDDIWAYGAEKEHPFVMHYDGTDWTSQATAEVPGLMLMTSVGTEAWGITADATKVVRRAADRWQIVWELPERLTALAGSGVDDVWLFLATGDIRHFDGNAWRTFVPAGPADVYDAVWAGGPRNVWAIGRSGHPIHFDGATWAPVRVPDDVPVAHISGSGDNVLLAAVEQVTFELTHSLPSAYGGACEAPLVVYCNTSMRGHTRGADDGPADCGGRAHSGGEVVYRLDNPVTGQLTARVTSASADLDLVVIGADERRGCDPDQCLAIGQTVGAATELTMGVRHGDLLYLAVGAADEPAPYTLEIACTKL